MDYYEYMVVYDDYRKLRYKVSEDVYDKVVEARRNKAIVEIPVKTLDKVFWVNKIGIEDDLRVFLKLYDDINQSLLKNNGRLVEALNSACIEVARTTYEDTLKIINGEAEIRNKSEKMVVNIYNVLNYMNKTEYKFITKESLMDVWEMIIDGVCENSYLWEKGKYRTGDIHVVDSQGKIVHTGVPVNKLDDVMDEFMDNYNYIDPDKVFALVKSFVLHYIFAYIHAFCDGNGRMARLLNNNNLIQAGWDKFRRLSISSAINRQRTGYYRSIDFSNNSFGDTTFFVKFMLKSISSLMYSIITGGN